METSFYQPDHYRLTKRVLLHQHTIQQHKLNINDTVIIKPHNQQQQPNTTTIHFAIGTIWPSSSNHHHHHSKDIVALSFDHLLNAAILPGQHVSITPLPPTNHTTPGRGGILQLPEAKEITLKHIHLTSLSEPYQQLLLSSQEETQLSQLNTQNNNNNRLWEAFIREVLVDRKYLAINHHISIPFANATRIFLIQDIQPLDPKHSHQAIELFLITRQTRLKVIPPSSSSSDQPPAPPTTDHHQLSYDAIGGLDLQVQQIRELVELPLTRPELYSHFDLTPPKGILLYGPPGTGKTLLASIIAKSTNSTLLTLSTATISSAYHGEAEQNIYEIFREAKAKAPSIMVIDEIDGLFPNREEGGDVDRRMVGALLTCMDGMDQKTVSPASLEAPRVMVVATTNRPHTLDPALRRPGRFDREIEIGIPDACGRHKILEVMLRKMPHQLTAEETKKIAERTHGFVGADLLALVREAGLRAIKRSLASSIRTEEMRLEPDDITQALLTVRPSAMRELHIETPRVTWADIGGQREVKQRLVETLSWPSKYPDTFDRLGIRPIRGILLYGPPGCSKTLIAKALASESDMNFIAIKGSDVFNKFLGESEKAIRDLFRKARAASPSIIFIDEIDSIAMARRSDDDGGGGVGDRVLTSLLVEMDGIEELRGVLVLAATNRPAAIDPALMRPGRLDRILYVGPPDLASRAEILAINFKKMAVHPDVDVQALAALTEGYTGAEIVAVCQDAAINAMHRDTHASCIEHQDFVRALAAIKTQLTPHVLAAYHNWRDFVPVQSV